MLLAIDIGNTHTVIGLFEGKRLRRQWRVNTDRQQTADELAVVYHGLFALESISPADVSAAIIASVVPPIQSQYARFIGNLLGRPPRFVDSSLDTGMPVRIEQPAEVGADRIVNGVAAFTRFKTALVVVDFGTATTFDCISGDGAYLGGAITPGLAISLDALGQRTAKLPRVDISLPPERAIGKNTVEAIRSGILYGYGGLVEGMIQRIRQEYAPEIPKVVATGGLAELIAPYAPSITETIPTLTLEGLRILHDRNS